VQNARNQHVTTLPAAYVADSTELGYATTIHGAQGVSVDTTHGLATGTESRQQLYTMLTRGPPAHPAQLQVAGPRDLIVSNLDAGVDRFVLGPARATRRPSAIALFASVRVGTMAALLLGPAAALGLSARVPGLVTGPRDAIVVSGDAEFTVRPAAVGRILRAAGATEAIARLVDDAELGASVPLEAPIATVLPRLDDAGAELSRAAADRHQDGLEHRGDRPARRAGPRLGLDAEPIRLVPVHADGQRTGHVHRRSDPDPVRFHRVRV